jgi:diacylglycerol kinase (ATP)
MAISSKSIGASPRQQRSPRQAAVPYQSISLQEPSSIPAESSASDLVDPFQRPPSWQVATTLVKSFQYAWLGVAYAFRTQRNFRIHVVIALIALSLGWVLQLAAMAMALISMTCGLVLAMELLNTALEAVVDLTVGREYHVLAQIAKDCAAAAVLIAALVAVLVAGFLLLPPLWLKIASLGILS